MTTMATPESARRYVAAAEIPEAARSRGPEETAGLVFDTARNQATVVGSEVVSFVKGVTPERREAIVNSSLLAQLVAKNKVPDFKRIYKWYESYFEVLENVGWVVQDKGFAKYTESGANFDAHKAILEVAAVVLGPAPAALAIVTSTINALHSMNEDQPWITIFNHESHKAKTARFQVSLAEQDADGQFFVNLLAFGLEASSRVTQVLFFKARRQDATFKHCSGRVTINSGVLDAVAPQIKVKIEDHAINYVSQLPDL